MLVWLYSKLVCAKRCRTIWCDDIEEPIRVWCANWLIPRWAGGVTIGRDIFIVKGLEYNKRYLAHEITHVRQWRRYGPLFVLIYLWQYITVGYDKMPLEREARRAAIVAEGECK